MSLSGWTWSLTERLLSRKNDQKANDNHKLDVLVTKEDDVGILDHVMKNDCTNNNNINNNYNNFCRSLYQELDQTKLLHRLQPAKTTGERRLEDLLELLHEQGVMNQIQIPLLQHQAEQEHEEIKKMIPPTIRGDKSLFVAREYRLGVHQQDFQQRHPLLHQWITTLSETIQQ
jgi:hypothetical protein